MARSSDPGVVHPAESRSGEDAGRGDKESGRHETASQGKTDRPTGKSTARDVTGVNPLDPITRPAGERSG